MGLGSLARVILGLTLCSAPAWASVEAIQLDYVALDASVQCNRIFFRSSQHFRNTIFVVPRIIAGAGPQGKRAFDIASTDDDGQYTLTLRVYFPSSDEHIKTGLGTRAERDFDACNFDKVKNALNNGASDAEKVTRIARMPLTSIELTIPGVADKGRIGRTAEGTEEVDILHYYGTSLNAYFKINEKEKAAFLQQALNPDGLGVQVKLRFQAKQRNGGVTATINTSTVQANFAAAVKGKSKMAKGEIKAALRASFTSNSIQVTSEAGKAGALEKIESMVIEQAMKDLAAAVEALPAVTADASDGDTEMVSVSAAMNALTSKISKQISIQAIAAPETATAQSEIKLKASRIPDPNLFEIEMPASAADPSSPFVMRKGQTFAISPAYSYVDKIEYETRESFLTEGEIKELGLHRKFPNMIAPNVYLANQEINGELMAVGSWYPWNVLPNMVSYRWVRIEKFPKRTRQSNTRYKPTREALDKIPVAVSFSALGDRFMYQMKDLLGDKGAFEATFEEATGRVFITAKQDLGAVNFRECMTGKDDVGYIEEEGGFITDAVVEERNPFLRSRGRSAPIALKKEDEAMSLQRTIVFFVTRPFVLQPGTGPGVPVSTPVITGTVPTQQ